MAAFVAWYNTEHRHSEIRYVTPAQRHAGQDAAILATRRETLERARARNPARWSREVRNCQPVGSVWLNPDTEAVPTHPDHDLEAA